MIRSQQWCIQQRPEGGYMMTRILNASKNTVSFSTATEQEALPKNIKGNIHFTFTPVDYHLYTDNYPKLKADLLSLQVKKRFIDLGVAMDASSFIHANKELEATNNRVNSIFIHQEDINQQLPVISSLRGIKKCTLLPAAASIAGLIKQVTEKAVLIILLGEKFSHLLVVKSGVPIYHQSLAQTGPGQVEEALIPNAIDFARVTVRKDHEIDEIDIARLGKRRDSIDLKNLDIEEWQPDFSKVIEVENLEDVFRYPHLYGGYFADPIYSFAPKEFQQAWALQNTTKTSAIIAAIAAVALLGGWLYLQPVLKAQKDKYSAMSSEIIKQKGQITERMPQTAMLNNFERLVNIRTKAKKDFRLDTLAHNLSISLPEEVKVTEVIVKRQATQGSNLMDALPPTEDVNDPALPEAFGIESLSLPEKTQDKPFTIALSCNSKGSYREVTTRFEKTAVALNDVFGVENLTWSYREEDQTGLLNCTLYPQTLGENDEL